MNMKRHVLSCVALACLSGLATQAYAIGTPGLAGKKISLAPLPVQIFMQPNERPALVVAMPCAMVNKMTFGFPPVTVMETVFFQMVGTVNSTNIMPVSFEPVCS